MTDHYDIFLSYSRNDLDAAGTLRDQLERSGLSVFRDEDSIREGERWLARLQSAVDDCRAFVLLVGRDGVARWIAAETEVALTHYFGPHDDTKRLPIFPILLGDAEPECLPAFLRLFQATRWDGAAALPGSFFEQVRKRSAPANPDIAIEGCPFVGLDAFHVDQAHLFFGRQKETLDALACFDTRPGSPTVRWLEINGNSGSGKSSLMNAGLLPLVDQGWLWPRTGFEHWRRTGPLVPGKRPVTMLAEHLARAFRVEMSEIRKSLGESDSALSEWLRGRKKDQTAFLLAVDQFEELFTFADSDERSQFDRLLAGALGDPDCPLFLISTVRADFLDRFEELPRLVALRNRLGRPWTLPPIAADALREIIAGPARLAGLDVSEVQEAMVAEASDEPGALPLVENALQWLFWEKRSNGRLSGRLLTEQGGLAGILSRGADDLLESLGHQRGRALELLFRLVKVDPESRRHTRRRIDYTEALEVAGGGDAGQQLLDRLAGRRRSDAGNAQGPLRLITITTEGAQDAGDGARRRVNLIHETLVRSKGLDARGKSQPYWPTLWNYIEHHKPRAARRERLELMAREWGDRRGLAKLRGLAGWSSVFGFRGLSAPHSAERRYLRWSRCVACTQILVLAALLGFGAENFLWARAHGLPLEAVAARWSHPLGKELPLPELVKIDAGDFPMGSEEGAPDERPVHRVTFAEPFHMAATETTFEQYGAYCTAVGCNPPDDAGWGRGDRPVIYVDWDDARAYANWLDAMTGAGCRLPSEAEWEYAARAYTTTALADTGTAFALPAPDGSDDISKEAHGTALANCSDCGDRWESETAPVSSFLPNDWGLHDMHGNVWEWVADCWHASYEGAPDDGSAWEESDGGSCGRRVVRGGSWDSIQYLARSAFRSRRYPDSRFNFIGFRVVCSSPID